MQTLRRLLLLILALLAATPPALAAPNAGDVFDRLWRRYDRPVQDGIAGRSWTWGPQLSSILSERYNDGGREVQYYEKGRMEVNDPNVDPSSPWYVTSGLLPIELMTGQRQFGDTSFDRWRESYLSAVGDAGHFPAYPDLLAIYESPGTVRPVEIGLPVTDMLTANLSIGAYTGAIDDPASILQQPQHHNGHGIPRAFVDFMYQRGPVDLNGRRVVGQIYDPLFIFGLPITPPVWVRTLIGGREQTVLLQVFERRVLTYNPANPPAFRVEMGNVGTHYWRWLVEPSESREWVALFDKNTRVVSPNNPQVVYTLDVDVRAAGPQPVPLIASYRLYRSSDGGATRALMYSAETNSCNIVGAWLLAPNDLSAHPDRIGLGVQCVDFPSAARGGGITILSSYDGGRSFITRAHI